MDTTFITIHDLSHEARILYSSDSIVDILGYSPEDVVGRSCWEFFHPLELPIAQSKHERSIELDKAAVLAYCKMKDRLGRWVGCEVVFTVVYDVLVGCTSIYQRSVNSENRAASAPAIGRIFSNSPSDPRYHMLSHLSSKFTNSMKQEPHEPRAALFLNRYTRTLTIMYATDGLADVLGIRSDDLTGQSFYYCIQEDCLSDAVRCLENAKSNDSIAYLRFWYRDPTEIFLAQASAGSNGPQAETEDEEMPDIGNEEGATQPNGFHSRHHRLPTSIAARENSSTSIDSDPFSPTDGPRIVPGATSGQFLQSPPGDSRTSSGDSNSASYEAIFGTPGLPHESSMSSVSNTPQQSQRPSSRRAIELEAVISCTSDGLVVCMRRARPNIPPVSELTPATASPGGLFAAPWATKPMYPPTTYHARPTAAPTNSRSVQQHSEQGRPANEDYMNAIRDIGVFAWAVTGINGSLAEYSRGVPTDSALPERGLPIWQSDPAQWDRAA